MRFILVKTGGRKFRCIGCEVPDPLQLPAVTKLLTGELRPPEWGDSLQSYIVTSSRPQLGNLRNRIPTSCEARRIAKIPMDWDRSARRRPTWPRTHGASGNW
jgi:hypothetical protein